MVDSSGSLKPQAATANTPTPWHLAGQDVVEDLMAYLNASPSPEHAVDETCQRLRKAGFVFLDRSEDWQLHPHGRYALKIHQGTVLAWVMGSVAPWESGFRILAAHTDSPNFRIKPLAEHSAHGAHLVGVAPYGGLIAATWTDRDLGLAGQVCLALQDCKEVLFRWPGPCLRISNLAIHLNRRVNDQGLVLDLQKHAAPIWDLDESCAQGFLPSLAEALTTQLQRHVAPKDILGFDLSLFDHQPAACIGPRRALLASGRLDNLASCHAGLEALLAQKKPQATCILACFDHEEVGSKSSHGAGSVHLSALLERMAQAGFGNVAHGLDRARGLSTVLSADMAHAVHPNFPEQHEPQHRPKMGKGPVIKIHPGQSYTTRSQSEAMFAELCSQHDVGVQRFINRSDLGCGSTVGPTLCAQLGMMGLDVGPAMLSMHSAREVMAPADQAQCIAAYGAFFAAKSQKWF